MMNVLLVNPAYPQTFWSFNNVLKLTGKKALLPPLGLITVAALFPQTWNFKLADLAFQTISEADWDWCDLVIVSGMAVQHRGIHETIREGKRRDKKVVVGGPWAFHIPEELLKTGADLVVVGEAETVMPEVLEAVEKGEFGKVIRSNGVADMEKSPPPRYDLLEIGSYVDVGLQFSRGCPFKCEFCDITLMLGRKVRTKSPEQVLAELEILYKLGWNRAVFFVDDNFVGNPSKAKHLLQELLPWLETRKRPFEFYTQASVNLAAQTENLDLMARCDFTRVFLGIETPDEDSLRAAGKLQNVATDLDKACRTINEAGLEIIAGCILGFDNEKPGADQRLIDFAVRNRIPEMFVTLLQAGPGTELWHRLAREGRLVSIDCEHLSNQTGMINFIPTRSVRQIVSEFNNLYSVLYERRFYLDRALRHLLRMKPHEVPKPFQMPYPYEVKAVAIAIIRHGLVYSSRWKFWECFFTLVRKNPVRLRNFLVYCVRYEHYSDFLTTIAEELQSQIASGNFSEEIFPLAGVQAPGA
jgi:radical SAM superfamily enzyme YgiQ (UPF0313 family)